MAQINFPLDRSELDQAINTGDFSPGTPLLDGDKFNSESVSFEWKQETGESFGRWVTLAAQSGPLDAATLEGEPGSYYTDYNNLTNVPETVDADTLNGQAGSYYTDFNNLTNVPIASDAPVDGTPYARQDSDWISITSTPVEDEIWNKTGSSISPLDTGANVGIGTTEPANKLDVSGAVGISYGGGIKLSGTPRTTNNDILFHEFASGDILNIAPAGNGAASEIVFKTAAGSTLAESMRIDKDGRVGIGTADPSARLQILETQDTADACTLAQFGTTSVFNGLKILTTDGNLTWGLDVLNQRNLSFRTNQQDRLFIDGSGNVGIGTDSPTSKLQVIGDSLGPTIASFRSPPNEVSYPATLEMLGNNSAGSASQQVQLTAYQPASGTGTDAALDFKVRKNGESFNSPSTKMTILGSGNVGIGTDAPSQKLDVMGTTFCRSAPAADVEAEQIRFGRSDNSTLRYHSIKTYHTSSANQGGNNRISFYLHNGLNNDDQVNVMDVRGNGNVDVAGTILATGYSLASLTELT